MNYETPQETAKRLNITVRCIQKWAADGKIEGAKKNGRSWLIPDTFTRENKAGAPSAHGSAAALSLTDGNNLRVPLPLIGGSFRPGEAIQYIHSLSDPVDQKVAWFEYCYFTGKMEEASALTDEMLFHEDAAVRYSARIISAFANLSIGKLDKAMYAFSEIQSELKERPRHTDIPGVQAEVILAANLIKISLQDSAADTSPLSSLEEYLYELPRGLRMLACYALSYKAYLEKNYERCIAISDIAVAFSGSKYPLATVFCLLSAAVGCLHLKRTEGAKKRFESAWAIAEPDGFTEPFSRHHVQLHSLVEAVFRKTNPQMYKKISFYTARIYPGWAQLRNANESRIAAENLSVTELSIANLYNQGWTVKEIAAHMGICERTVKSRLKIIYEKLDISKRKNLSKFLMLD